MPCPREGIQGVVQISFNFLGAGYANPYDNARWKSQTKTNTANISRKATSSLRSTAEDGIEARYGGFSSAYSPWILSVQDVCALCVHVADWESGKAERIVVDEDGARDEGVVHPPKVPRNPSYWLFVWYTYLCLYMQIIYVDQHGHRVAHTPSTLEKK